jgi:transposase-like protein
MSVRAWCRRHALRESSFYWWRTQLARRDAQASAFVPVLVTADRSVTDAFELSAVNGSQSRIEIVLQRGRRVHVIGPVNRQALADVLAVLTAASGGEAEAC